MALLSASVVLGHLVECCCSEESLSKTDVVGKFVEKASNNQSTGRRADLAFFRSVENIDKEIAINVSNA